MEPSKEWYRDDFLISTSSKLLQPSAINAAFATDQLYWAKALSAEAMTKMLSKSLCFGVYALPKTSSELAGRSNPPQIGFGRLITDEVTIAYLTDVYILPEYQGKGLGTWLLGCIGEVINDLPDLRRSLLLTSSENGKVLYKKIFGMAPFPQGKGGLEILSSTGKGSVLPH